MIELFSKKLLTVRLFFIALFFLLISQPAQAQENFTTQLQANYEINAEALAKVELNFTLTNSSATTYITNYQLNLNRTEISSLVVQPKKQEIEKEIKTEGGQFSIDLKFINQVVGQGKSREFSVEYIDAGLAQIRGKNVIVRIPPLLATDNYRKYQVKVTVPTAFGELTAAVPSPIKKETKAGVSIYEFNLNTPEEIVLQYGSEQILQFNIEQALVNESQTSVYKEIHLPTNSPEQEFYYAFFKPEPTSHLANEQGLFLYYLLSAGEKKNFQTQGYAKLKNLDENYKLEDHLPPSIKSGWQSFFIEEIPAEFLATLNEKPTLEMELDRWWFLPLPGRNLVMIENHTGSKKTDLLLQVATSNDKVKIEPSSQSINLWPWQKTVALVEVSPLDWWPIYQQTDLQLKLLASSNDSQEQQILDEKERSSFTLSYPSLALIGGFFATAITSWRLLVARRK